MQYRQETHTSGMQTGNIINRSHTYESLFVCHSSYMALFLIPCSSNISHTMALCYLHECRLYELNLHTMYRQMDYAGFTFFLDHDCHHRFLSNIPWYMTTYKQAYLHLFIASSPGHRRYWGKVAGNTACMLVDISSVCRNLHGNLCSIVHFVKCTAVCICNLWTLELPWWIWLSHLYLGCK